MSVGRFLTAWRAAGGRSARLALPVPFPFRRSYDTTRARTELGWRSRPAGDALRETLALETRPWRRRRGAARLRPAGDAPELGGRDVAAEARLGNLLGEMGDGAGDLDGGE